MSESKRNTEMSVRDEIKDEITELNRRIASMETPQQIGQEEYYGYPDMRRGNEIRQRLRERRQKLRRWLDQIESVESDRDA